VDRAISALVWGGSASCREDKESTLSTPSFYTDRMYGAVPRTLETLPDPTAEGLKSLVQRRIEGNWLAEEFPSYCPDGDGIEGTNKFQIGPDLVALVPGATWPLWQESVADEVLFDVVEYVGQRLSEPSNGRWHDFFKHHELTFDKKAGRSAFRSDVNTLLSRGGTVFEMNSAMQIERAGSPEVQAALRQLRSNSGDATLDDLLESARGLYLSRSAANRKIAIEKLWDAFERLKTLDVPTDKKKSVAALLDHIGDPAFREVVGTEMANLTSFGNSFQIRHHEVGKHALRDDAEDYVVARMANLLILLLASSHRL
jgi:hypothetical protein